MCCIAMAKYAELSPLIVDAVSSGDIEKTKELCSWLNINHSVDRKGRNLLSLACVYGHIDLVRFLVSIGADVNPAAHYNFFNSGRDAPLTLAVINNHTSLVSVIVNEFGCDPNDGVSLHTACYCGNLSMVKTLIECGASVDDKDFNGNTSLHLAVKNGNYQIAQLLLKDFKSNTSVKDKYAMSLLHTACENGNLRMVELLIYYGADFNEKNGHSKTPLAVAIENDHSSIVSALLSEFGCDPNDRVSLHTACVHGNLSMVKTLIEHGASVDDKDCDEQYTPLQLALTNHHDNIVSALISEFGCDPKGVSLHMAFEHGNLSVVKTLIDIGVCVNVSEKHTGKTPLHAACEHGNLSVMKKLTEHGANLNDVDWHGNTPLSLAIEYNHTSIVSALVSDFGCDPNDGVSLHTACKHGNLSMAKTMIEHGASVNKKAADGRTPLAQAVCYNQCEMVKLLVSEYGCDVNVRGKGGRSLLHLAATKSGVDMLYLLIKEYGMAPLLVDEKGNTPLHLCSRLDIPKNMTTLLYEFHAPVYVRNRAGKTPKDVAHYYSLRIFRNYIKEHQATLEEDYRVMQKLAATKYSGSHCITRVFVLGHPGAGKSSLVEALKREGFIQSFNRVSSKSVALHTAGIVPSIHTSDSYGRVQFYDFAGDPEYYSSHAAILEKLFLSDIGNNICIIVLNLEDEDIGLMKKYLYWLSFINHNTKNLENPPSIIVTGSHTDLLSRQGLQKKEGCIKSLLSKYGTDHVYLSLDCCGPRSRNIRLLRQQIQDFSNIYEPYDLSYEDSVLLGLLEKDFTNVTTCTAKTIASHISDVNLLRLPRSVSGLYPILKQLQAIGSLLILGGMKEDCYLVLNVSQLTNEVHKRLFSEKAFSNKPDMASFNIGLLPQSLLQEVLPPYITKECLTQLQYCQEISHVDIGQDYFISPTSEGVEVSSSPDKSLLFFPALCKLDKSNVSWLIPTEGSYSIGWLARCTISRDFFPPRFLHVLLLRISLRFTLVAPTNLHTSQDTPPDHVPLKRRCKMWKTGVHWLTEEGVECEVDVDISKQVVVSIRSEEHSKKVFTVFNSIISCVMEAKAEFCHSIQLKCFLLDKVGCLSEDNLFQIEEVERVLTEHNDKVISARGNTWMSSSKLLHIRCTFWDSLFPLDEQSVLQYIEDLVDEWFQLGEHLELPHPTLRAIESDFPNSVRRRKLEMVTTWLSSPNSHPPCWWSLVKALQEMGENASAAAIIKDKGMDIEFEL